MQKKKKTLTTYKYEDNPREIENIFLILTQFSYITIYILICKEQTLTA